MRLLLILVILLAGCAQTVDENAGPVDPGVAWLETWVSPNLIGPRQDHENNPPPFMERPPRPACDGANCHVFDLEVPPSEGKDLVISIEWEGQDETYTNDNMPGPYLGSPNLMLDFVVLLDGEQVVDGEESFHYAGVAVIPDPEAGTYQVEVVARYGTGSYLGAARFQEPIDRSLGLPDLVMLPPDHLGFGTPLGREGEGVLSLIAPGCGPDEFTEDLDMRCLRFAGILGNQGPGDFEARLQYDQAQSSVYADGRWEQVVFTEDGEEVRQIGSAHYHAVHGHFHILDFVETHLYEYDEDSDERGQETGYGRKTGFCIIDGGLVDPLAPAVPPRYHGNGCCYLAGLCQLDMATNPYFVMGMSAGWYDIYPWWRADQYVEVTGLPDGTYELVSRINPDGLLVETDMENNEASTVFRLAGNTVEMVRQQTQADVGPHPDADWDNGPA